MKMHKHFGLVLTACLVLSLLFTPAFLLPAQAANTVTVQGKVMSGTTGSLLLLDTPQGKMEIKIDNATDTTAGKILLPDQMIPAQWYNIVADMPQKPLPPLDPRTRRPVTAEQMNCIFAEELVRQEFSTERFIDIPDEVRDLYRIWRCTPLVRAYALERALDTPAKIYFKNESVSPAGSHKPNTAVPQAYYNYKQGIRHLTTETGAGQWGAAIAFAAKHFGLDVQVFMVKVSYEQKPYRRLMMNTWGAECIASPSTLTASGRAALERDPNCSGSLGLAISEAVEMALRREAEEELGLTGFTPERLPHYVFESDRERELVFPYRCTYDGDIHPSAETDGGRFWSTTEIHEAMGKGIFTPNFESEYKRLFGNEPDMLL